MFRVPKQDLVYSEAPALAQRLIEGCGSCKVKAPPIRQLFAFDRVENLTAGQKRPTARDESHTKCWTRTLIMCGLIAALLVFEGGSVALAFELSPAGRTIVTEEGRRVTPKGSYKVGQLPSTILPLPFHCHFTVLLLTSHCHFTALSPSLHCQFIARSNARLAGRRTSRRLWEWRSGDNACCITK